MSGAEREEDKDLATRPKKEEVKFCPLRGFIVEGRLGNEPCLKEKCALWVDIVKDSSNPFYYGEYHGCGLLPNLPYVIVKRKL